MKPIKVSILGADGYTCQIPRIKEGIQNLGHILSEESPDLIYANDPTGYNKAMILKKKFPNSYLIFNFLDVPWHLPNVDKQTQIYSTKTLTESQRHLFKNIKVDSSDFLKISLNRIPKPILKSKIDNVIITSQNAVEAITRVFPKEELQFKNIYCVGRRTKKLIESKIGKVKHSENNAKALADYLVDFIDGTDVTYFCSDIRLDELPTILEENNIKVNEVEAYKTILDATKIDATVEGVMFYSPSTVESYMQNNKADKIAYCIGDTTATEAKKYFKDVRVAKIPTVESVIELVNENYK